MTTCAYPKCSSEVPAGKRLYCSSKCYELDKSRRRRIAHPRIAPPVQCQRPGCENKYQAVGGRRYCSDECAEVMRKKAQAERDARRPNRGRPPKPKQEAAPKPPRRKRMSARPDTSPDALAQAKRQLAKMPTIKRWSDEPMPSLLEGELPKRVRPNYKQFGVQ